MADFEPSGEDKQHHQHWDGDLPTLHGPPTAQEQQIADEKAAIQAEKVAEAALRLQELNETVSGNRLTRTYIKLTFVLAFFSALGTVAAWYQGIVANKNAHSAEISAQAAKSAAKTASKTLKEMKTEEVDTLNASSEAMLLDQRAWVGLSQVKVVRIDPEHIEGIVSNSGKTPAREVRAVMGFYIDYSPGGWQGLEEHDYNWMSCIEKKAWNHEIKQTDYLYGPMPINPPYRSSCGLPRLTDLRRDVVGAPQLKSLAVIPPGNSPYRLPLSGSTVNQVFTLVFYGEIKYIDFLNKKQRSTQFCYLEPSGSLDYYPCDKLNDMN